IAPGPIEYTGSRPFNRVDSLVSLDNPELSSLAAKIRDRISPEDARQEINSMKYAASSAIPVELQLEERRRRLGRTEAGGEIETKSNDTGATFQYIVTAPVSVRRCESALVPIIGKDVKYQRELLYNAAKFPKHPVASLRFDNDTGLTLERGPVTVVEDG